MIGIALIGCTGSIGTQVKEIVRRYPDRYKIVSLSANRSIDAWKQDILEFEPSVAGISDKDAAKDLPSKIGHTSIVIGDDANERCIELSSVSVAVISVVGMVGLRSVMAAIRCGKRIALANKESLVTGGELVMRAARDKNVPILPVDSEHSAIFQCLHAGKRSDVKRIILTASGGPFRTMPVEQFRDITVEDALKHPTWKMGSKITIDSATLMNKGLEIIEARWLFDTLAIEAVIQPQSVVHSMVEFRDNSVIAQLSYPTMELPIQLALTYPERLPTVVKPLDFSTLGTLTFEPIDTKKFRCLDLAMTAMREGGLQPTVMNAANEAAVQLFLERKLPFYKIPSIIEQALSSDWGNYSLTVDDIYALTAHVKQSVSHNTAARS